MPKSFSNKISIDGLVIAKFSRSVFKDMHKGQITAANCTCSVWENFYQTIENLTIWNDHFKENSDIIYHIKSYKDIKKAQTLGKVGIILGWQNTSAIENKKMVKSKIEIDKNIKIKKFQIIDARSYDRFKGIVSEIRPNLKSGSIEGSSCLPFTQIINKNNNTFKNTDELNQIFKKVINTQDNNIVFSCGSGVTASVLALAYSLINNKYTPTIYDGSWSEYGLVK